MDKLVEYLQEFGFKLTNKSNYLYIFKYNHHNIRLYNGSDNYTYIIFLNSQMYNITNDNELKEFKNLIKIKFNKQRRLIKYKQLYG